jgi:hypothetical protein
MKTTEFNSKITSAKLAENISKQFGVNVVLDKYNREQLEDFRNKLRTKIFQQEGASKINDLLTNETYQKDKAMLDLLNTRIKEMLGEDMKKLRDKIDQLTEAKKSKPDFLDLDKDGNKTEPMKKAAKDAKVKEGAKPDFLDLDKDGNKTEPMKKAAKDAKVKEAAGKCTCEMNKKTCKVHGKKMDEGKCNECGMWESKCKCDHVDESSEKPSAGLSKAKKSAIVKKAKKGGDIGKPGKSFDKVAKSAGGGEKGKRIAAAAMWKNAQRESIDSFKKNVKLVNESLIHLLQEDEEGKAKAITAAGDMVNDFTSWMQRVGQYQTKAMIELADAIRADFGQQESETFKQAVAPALTTTLETLTQQREVISHAVAVLAGESAPSEPMGSEPAPMEPGLDATSPDAMNPEPAGDEFGASDAAAGAGTTGREMRESREERRARRLAEEHSIIARLAK